MLMMLIVGTYWDKTKSHGTPNVHDAQPLYDTKRNYTDVLKNGAILLLEGSRIERKINIILLKFKKLLTAEFIW